MRKTFETYSLSWEVNVGGQCLAAFNCFVMDAPVIIITKYILRSYNDVSAGVYVLHRIIVTLERD